MANNSYRKRLEDIILQLLDIIYLMSNVKGFDVNEELNMYTNMSDEEKRYFNVIVPKEEDKKTK